MCAKQKPKEKTKTPKQKKKLFLFATKIWLSWAARKGVHKAGWRECELAPTSWR
jgi:hypothetical protein